MKFLENINKYVSYYDEYNLKKKLRKFGKTIGTTIINWVLILTILITDKKIPLKIRMLFIASLGYLILPSDLIADLLPVIGFSDDVAFITYVIKIGSEYITPEVKEKANNKMRNWLDNVAEEAEFVE